MQQIREIISTKSSKIAICINLDPQKFSTIRYALYTYKAWRQYQSIPDDGQSAPDS